VKILNLPDVLHEYLVHLIETHAARGIHPEEGMAIARLWQCVQNVTTIPDDEIRRVAAAGTPSSAAVATHQMEAVFGGPDRPSDHVHSPTDPHVPGQPCACDPRIPVPRTEPKDDPPGQL